MNHLIVSREFPPAPYPPGGIGTYVRSIAQLLVEAGETVHVIAQRWDGAPKAVEETANGRLIVHRVSLREPIAKDSDERARLRALATSDCPYQVFSWQAARLAESLIEGEGIDVVEAQEWEAPLYFLQRRRAEGRGPKRQPPCLITLHSPSEFIFRHNEWDVTLTDFPPLRQREAYTIAAADGLLSPSRYLAVQAARHFRVAPASIEVIPYPVADSWAIDRTSAVWESDKICYVGRLELRKGVLELISAGVQVARENPTVYFEFIGADTSLTGGPGSTVLPRLMKEIPRSLRGRFRFRGNQPRQAVRTLLQESCASVVPARWENLPYSCLEAMSTGLPVIASPAGGMSELVNDGRTGWLAPDATAAGLSAALRRMLASSAAERARMGKEAAATVQRICGSSSVLARHLDLRRRLAAGGALRSNRFPETHGDNDQRPTDDLFLDRKAPCPAVRGASEGGDRSRPRYSAGALALGRFQTSFLDWFMRAPLSAKLTAISHALRQPHETARWVGWRARHLAERLRRTTTKSAPIFGQTSSSNRTAGDQ